MYIYFILLHYILTVSAGNLSSHTADCKCLPSKLKCFSLPQTIGKIRRNSTQEIFLSSLYSCRDIIYLKLTHLDTNQIDGIISQNLSQVLLLHVSDSNNMKLREEMFSHVRSLRELTLVRNQIVQVKRRTFLSLTELQLLNLNSNRIRSLTQDCFQDLSNLQELYLKHNQISSIHTGVFREMRKLRILDLSHNNIKHLTDSVFRQLKHLKSLKIFIGTPQVNSSGPSNPSEEELKGSDRRQESRDGDLLMSFQILLVVSLIGLSLTAFIISYLRKRETAGSSIFLLYEEEDAEAGDCADQLRFLLPELSLLSCWESALPGEIKVTDREGRQPTSHLSGGANSTDDLPV